MIFRHAGQSCAQYNIDVNKNTTWKTNYNFYKEALQQEDENLENIANDDDSYEDDLDLKGYESGSKNELQKLNKNQDSEQVKKFVSPNVHDRSMHSKNLNADEERDVESVNESFGSKGEETKPKSQGLHSINRKKVLMTAGAVFVILFAIAIFLAIYHCIKNQRKNENSQDKINFNHSFQDQAAIFEVDNENYDLEWVVVKWE